MFRKVVAHSGLAVVLLLSVTLAFVVDEDPVVDLPDGRIRGRTLRSQNGDPYYAFQEIPYASPPIGELRFKPATPPKKWNGILETKRNTKICYQYGQDFIEPAVIQTEDCLYINVYTPKKPRSSSELVPVFVWIHGGGFQTGSAVFETFGPTFIIDADIVIVALNYRLGPLGFLTTVDDVIPGNLGLRDQSFALKWVQENIALFGGDPKQVTIAGESAGGMSVGFQLISKQSKGLFRGAIIQSGTPLSPGGNQNQSRLVAFEIGKALDPKFDSQDSNDLLELLQSVPVNAIYNANIPEDSYFDLPFAPVIEDEEVEGAFITGPMHEDLKNGRINQVPTIIGFNSEEYKFFAARDLAGLRSRAELYDNKPSVLLDHVFEIRDENKDNAGRELRQIYTDTSFQDSVAAIVSYMSDLIFTTPTARHADLQSQYTDVYLYQFAYKGRLGMDNNIEGVDPTTVGHAEELGYIWDMGFNSDSSKYPKEDIQTRNRLLKLWTNFVKYQNPTPEEDELLQNLSWPKVTPGQLNYLNINATLEIQVDPKHYKEWKKIIDAYAIPPFITY